jgi:RNA polymerase-binding protein DksA
MARSTRKSAAGRTSVKDTPAKVAARPAASDAASAGGSAGTGAAKAATPRPATKTASATKKVTAPAKSGSPTAKKAAKASPAKKAAPSRGSASAKRSAPAKKAPVSSLVVQEGEEAWTKAELAEVLDELNEQREHSLAVLLSQESELTGLMRDSGDGAGQDQADLGATSFERDHELTVVNSERDKLAQIERALARIDDGSYGVCESCGSAIGKMRLMAFPRATLCMRCKQREERR